MDVRKPELVQLLREIEEGPVGVIIVHVPEVTVGGQSAGRAHALHEEKIKIKNKNNERLVQLSVIEANSHIDWPLRGTPDLGKQACTGK